jgi:hypothetical protein
MAVINPATSFRQLAAEADFLDVSHDLSNPGIVNTAVLFNNCIAHIADVLPSCHFSFVPVTRFHQGQSRGTIISIQIDLSKLQVPQHFGLSIPRERGALTRENQRLVMVVNQAGE